MSRVLPLYDRLGLVANVSDLLLAGSIHAYRPEERISTTTVHDKLKIAA